MVRDGFNALWDDHTAGEPAEGVAELLAVGESQTVEFKSTARWNVRAGRPDKRMEHAIAKTVGGFLNAQGGKLLIGVDDDAAWSASCRHADARRQRQPRWLRTVPRHLLDNSLSVRPLASYASASRPYPAETYALSQPHRRANRVFAKPHEGSTSPTEFWVRTGNATKQLHGDDMLEYQANHWGT